jgi:hypothetical protein
MSIVWLVIVLGGIVVLGLYLSNAFERIAEIEKRLDALEGKEK